MVNSKQIALIGEDCVACGSCLKCCPRQAISVLTGVIAVIASERCVGCGKCVITCPAGVIELKTRGEGL